MPIDPLTGSRYPASSAAPNVSQDIQNAVLDLSDNTIPYFGTTTERNNAYSAYVTAGGTMKNGMRCVVNSVPYRYIASNWRVDRARIFYRSVSGLSSHTITAGGSTETGLTSGITLIGGSGASFTLYEATRVKVDAAFRAGGPGAAQCTVKINAATISNAAISRTDVTTYCTGAVDLAAGTHSVSLRVDAISGSVSWVDGSLSMIEGVSE